MGLPLHHDGYGVQQQRSWEQSVSGYW